LQSRRIKNLERDLGNHALFLLRNDAIFLIEALEGRLVEGCLRDAHRLTIHEVRALAL
jgi:hypothetical protein